MSCICCKKILHPIFANVDLQPSQGVVATAAGNYGSRVYDPLTTDERLLFFVCDDCLLAAGEAGEVLLWRYSADGNTAPWQPPSPEG